VTKTVEESLTSKVVKGGGWMLITRLVTRLVGFGVSMVLARLLTPEAYGLVAVGTLTISLLQVFTDVGFQQSLIQESDDIKPLIGTAWTVGVLRGIVISMVMFLLAPWISRFFGLPEAAPIVRVFSLHPFIYSLTNIHIIFFQKELDFFKQFIYEVSALAGNLIVGIGLALLWQNAWALVAGQLASVTIQVVVSYFLFPALPSLEMDWASARDLYNFGKWVFWGGIVSYFSMRGDTYFVGRLFNEKVLGLYTMAYRIANLPVDELKRSLARVLFPAYAKIQNNPQKLNRAFLSAYKLLSSFMLPASIGLALVAPDFINVILGDKWVEMVPLLRILGFAAASRALMVAGSGFTWGVGSPHINFYQSLASGGVLFAMLLFLPRYWGLMGVGWAVLFSNIVNFMVGVVFITKRLGVDLSNWMRKLLPIGVSLLLMSLNVIISQMIFKTGLMRLVISCLWGGVIYMGSLMIFGHFQYRRLVKFLKEQLEHLK
jgi:O-antigen/teichoic acid export membrane protein